MFFVFLIFPEFGFHQHKISEEHCIIIPIKMKVVVVVFNEERRNIGLGAL